MTKAVRFVTSSRKKDRLAETSKDLSIIIPTAGIGHRMKVSGAHALLEFNNEPLLRMQIKNIKKVYPHADIIVVVGYEAHKIMNGVPEVRFVENENYESTNVLRSIGMGIRAAITERILIVYGDIYFDPTILNQSDNESWVIGDTKMKNTSIGMVINNQYAVNFAYDLETKWGKIVHLQGNELKIFKKIACDPNNKKLLGYEALNTIINKGGNLKCKLLKPTEKIHEIDSYKDLQGIV